MLSQADIERIETVMDWLHLTDVAQLERLVLRGLHAQGLGRPRRIMDDTVAEVIRLRSAGYTIADTAARTHIGKTSVKAIMRAHRDKVAQTV